MDRMPDSAYNHDFGAIEAAVKETARGRAFLADYAKKVRQSDTLTLLAMIGRLERWCEQQTVRIGEIAARNGLPEGKSSEQDGLGGWPGLDHRRNLSLQLGQEAPARGPEPNALACSADAGNATSATGNQHYEIAGRIGYLETVLSELDRKVAGLTDERRSPHARKDSEQVTVLEGRSTALTFQLGQPDTSRQILADDRHQTGACSEDDVLDDIAKALR